MSKTLNELIEAAITGSEEYEEVSPEVEKIASAATAPSISDDIEKVASALEFLGRRGVENFLRKEAMHGGGNVGTDAHGKAKGALKSSSHENRTHHPSLSSSAAAQNYTKKEKTKMVKPALKAVLDTPAFADSTKELLDAAGKYDKSMSKAAMQKMVKEALATRVLEQREKK